MKEAIEKLKSMAADNEKMCCEIESGNIKLLNGISSDRVKILIETYRYWHRSCLIAAWLLEQEDG